MRRPAGIVLISLLIAAASVGMLIEALPLRRGSPFNRAFITCVAIAALGLVAAQALWRLRPYAFLTFTLWSVGVASWLVMVRLGTGSSAHLIRLFEPLLYLGLAYAVLALYLRRVV
ncbi:MAG TPA: hypothetical protein VFW45_18845 [Candidatus Polarisedimenticolia bacterium]|nr:hypothetical protein [Candidatus Polarisedimenticolia bacterium]